MGLSPELSPGLIADAGSPSQGLPVTTGESQEPHLCTDVRTGVAEAAQAAFPVLPSDSITRPSTTIRATSIESVPASRSKGGTAAMDPLM